MGKLAAALFVTAIVFSYGIADAHAVHDFEDNVLRRELRADDSAYRCFSDSSETLTAGKVIPDVIRGVETRRFWFEACFYFGRTRVAKGVELTPNASAAQPSVNFTSNSRANRFYTLLMTDPDAPSPTNRSSAEILHWLVTNIQGNNFTSGTSLQPYRGPAPPTGIHRYVIHIYQQPGLLNLTAPAARSNFNSSAFALRYQLGLPFYATWFTAQPVNTTSNGTAASG